MLMETNPAVPELRSRPDSSSDTMGSLEKASPSTMAGAATRLVVEARSASFSSAAYPCKISVRNNRSIIYRLACPWPPENLPVRGRKARRRRGGTREMVLLCLQASVAETPHRRWLIFVAHSELATYGVDKRKQARCDVETEKRLEKTRNHFRNALHGRWLVHDRIYEK